MARPLPAETKEDTVNDLSELADQVRQTAWFFVFLVLFVVHFGVTPHRKG